MITPSAQWASLSSLPGELGAVARLYYGSEGSGDYVSLATKDLVLDGERFAGLLEAIPSKSNGVDLITHIPLTDSFTLTIDNLEYQPGKRFSDLLEELGTGSDIGFENRRIDVRLYLPGITTFANCLEIQTNGIMREPTHSRSMTTFTVFDGTELFLAKISHHSLRQMHQIQTKDSHQPPEEKKSPQSMVITLSILGVRWRLTLHQTDLIRWSRLSR